MIVAAIKHVKPRTYWNYEIRAVEDENGNKVDRSLVTSSTSTLEGAIKKMMADAIHYIGCGYRIEISEIMEMCSKCNGSGFVPHRTRRMNVVACKSCDNVGTFSKLSKIEHPELSRGLVVKFE